MCFFMRDIQALFCCSCAGGLLWNFGRVFCVYTKSQAAHTSNDPFRVPFSFCHLFFLPPPFLTVFFFFRYAPGLPAFYLHSFPFTPPPYPTFTKQSQRYHRISLSLLFTPPTSLPPTQTSCSLFRTRCVYVMAINNNKNRSRQLGTAAAALAQFQPFVHYQPPLASQLTAIHMCGRESQENLFIQIFPGSPFFFALLTAI